MICHISILNKIINVYLYVFLLFAITIISFLSIIAFIAPKIVTILDISFSSSVFVPQKPNNNAMINNKNKK